VGTRSNIAQKNEGRDTFSKELESRVGIGREEASVESPNSQVFGGSKLRSGTVLSNQDSRFRYSNMKRTGEGIWGPK